MLTQVYNTKAKKSNLVVLNQKPTCANLIHPWGVLHPGVEGHPAGSEHYSGAIDERLSQVYESYAGQIAGL